MLEFEEATIPTESRQWSHFHAGWQDQSWCIPTNQQSFQSNGSPAHFYWILFQTHHMGIFTSATGLTLCFPPETLPPPSRFHQRSHFTCPSSPQSLRSYLCVTTRVLYLAYLLLQSVCHFLPSSDLISPRIAGAVATFLFMALLLLLVTCL